MDAVTAASLQDLIRRLRLAGDEYSDLRCFLSHGLSFSWGDAGEEFGEAFGWGTFRPVNNDDGWWQIAFYRESVRNLSRGPFRSRSETNYLEKVGERNESARPIQLKMKTLFSDAYWIASSVGLSRIPGVGGVDILHPSYLTWLWLLYHAAWTCPQGTILRASKQYPANLMTRLELREKQEAAVGYEKGTPGGFEAFQKAQEAVRERNKKLSKEEREREWMEIYDKNCCQALERVENGEFLSILPIDPFTASALLLDLMAVSEEPVTTQPSIVLNGPGKPIRVNGSEMPILTDPQYNVINALMDAGTRGLNKDELVQKSGHTDAVKILKRIAGLNDDWKTVIGLAGKRGGRYRILDPHQSPP